VQTGHARFTMSLSLDSDDHPLDHSRHQGDGLPASPQRRHALATAGALVLSNGLAGCALLFRPSPIKMDVLYDDRGCTLQAPVLLVLLPGANMAPAEMEREGFVAALRQRRLAVDVAIADAHLGYVYDGSVLSRLHEDVIAPARAQGYRRIWLAGISLGGFVAMGYALQHPGEIEGLVALAPYLGRQQLQQEITAAGGPVAWRRGAQARQANDNGDTDDTDQRLWLWLSALPASAPPLWLGYGRDDRFAAGHRMLAELLPPTRVSTAEGGHEWSPWRALWSQWLDRGLLPTACE
jgi:pimeloyl-ACP methyl ester carboxylesterase